MQGFPTEANRPVTELTLELLEDVAYVAQAGARKPPIEVIGPVPAGLDPEIPADLVGLPSVVPVSRAWNGHRVTFTFDAPLGEGTYRVRVNPTCFRMESGPLATTFDGWTLTVLLSWRDDAPLAAPQAPAVAVAPMAYLDGRALGPVEGELSGEILRVEHAPNEVAELELVPVDRALGEAKSLYVSWAHSQTVTLDDGREATHFFAVGPLEHSGTSYAWAKYYGSDTEGRPPVAAGRLITTTGVTRTPGTGALLTAPYADETHATNGFRIWRPELTPLSASASAEEPLVGRPFAELTDEVDADQTVKTNPRLIPGAVAVVDPSEWAVLDLPLNHRFRIKVAGRVISEGYTRLSPLAIAVSQLYPETKHEEVGLRPAIRRATIEALRHWVGAIPTRVPQTIEAYVLTRMAMGERIEDGLQGEIDVRVGEARYRGRGDNALKRRLAAIARLLSKGIEELPLSPEDTLPSAIALVGSKASPAVWPAPRHGRAHRARLSTNRPIDPDEFAR